VLPELAGEAGSLTSPAELVGIPHGGAGALLLWRAS
jgi:hypothetical protein